MAGFCLLPAVFLRTAHCLGRTAAQFAQRPLGNPSGAAEPAVSRLRAALSGRNRASMAESISPLQIGLVSPAGRRLPATERKTDEKPAD